MTLANNSIVLDRTRDRRLRLLDQIASPQTPDPEPVYFVFIQLDIEKLVIEHWGRKRTLDAVLNRDLVVLPDARNPVHLEHLTPAEQRAVERRWSLVSDAQRRLGYDLYHERERGALSRELMQARSASKPLFYTSLRLYWQNGGGKTSLLTRRDQCGAPGVRRLARQGAPKTGRPRTIQPGIGLAITVEHLRLMRIAFHRAPVGRDGKLLRGAWHWLLVHHYSEHVRIMPDTSIRSSESCSPSQRPSQEPAPLQIQVGTPDAVPSFEQFRYHFQREFSYSELLVKRLGRRRAHKTLKALTTGTLNEVRAPGTRYYIDATVIDDYVVSGFDRNLVVGRPTLYLVIDQKTRLIVGMYVGLEPPCWVGAMLALYNCCVDKVAFCATYDIAITPEQWPTGFIPLHLMGDRAELMSAQANQLISGFNLDVENATAFCGEAKGVVERGFRTLQAKFGPYLPGFVLKDPPRGEPPPSSKAKINLIELTRTLLMLVLQANHRIIRDYEADPELIAAGVPTQPLALWHWYAQQMRTDYRRYNLDYVRRYLWPRSDLKLTRKALHFLRGIYYQGESLELQQWYAKAFVNGARFEALYHPLYLQKMTVIAPQERYAEYEVSVTRRSARVLHDASLSELMTLQAKKGRTNAAQAWDSLAENAHWDAAIHDTIREGKAQYKAQRDANLSPHTRTKNIRNNRDAELDRMSAHALASSGLVTPTIDVSPSPRSRVASRVRDLIAARSDPQDSASDAKPE